MLPSLVINYMSSVIDYISDLFKKFLEFYRFYVREIYDAFIPQFEIMIGLSCVHRCMLV